MNLAKSVAVQEEAMAIAAPRDQRKPYGVIVSGPKIAVNVRDTASPHVAMPLILTLWRRDR